MRLQGNKESCWGNDVLEVYRRNTL